MVPTPACPGSNFVLVVEVGWHSIRAAVLEQLVAGAYIHRNFSDRQRRAYVAAEDVVEPLLVVADAG